MKTTYFDGRRFAVEKENGLKEKVASLGTTPKLVSVVVGDEGGAQKYQELKQKRAKEIGAEIEIKLLAAESTHDDVISAIKTANADPAVFGVMVQLPLPKDLTTSQFDIIESIEPTKDVDGMREDSPFVAPVVLAVEAALKASRSESKKMAIVGANGFVGKKLVEHFSQDYKVDQFDFGSNLGGLKGADIVISAVGKKDLIKGEMVKDGVVLIDVGAPDGDIAKETYPKASFVSPVPGGVGPVTIYFLLKNLTTQIL